MTGARTPPEKCSTISKSSSERNHPGESSALILVPELAQPRQVRRFGTDELDQLAAPQVVVESAARRTG